MSDEPQDKSIGQFLIYMKSISDRDGISIHQFLNQCPPAFLNSLTVTQLNELVDIASNRVGIWTAEYLFSPSTTPSMEAKKESDSWRELCESWIRILMEHCPDAQDMIERRYRLTVARHSLEKSVKYNRNKLIRRFTSTLLFQIAIALNRLGLESVATYLYGIAIYPNGTIGRTSKC